MEKKFLSQGINVTVWPEAKIIYPENIAIGDESVIDDFVFMYASGAGIRIGCFCHITACCCVMAGGLVKFGDFSAIGPGTIVVAETDDYHGNGFIGLQVFNRFKGQYRNSKFADVILEKHVHVGAGSIILPGVHLGEGCSIGAGSVVTKDMPEWSICFGNPCKPRKSKPKEKQLEMEKQFLKEYYG